VIRGAGWTGAVACGAAALFAAAALTLSACGDSTGERPRLTVAAAQSLAAPFERYGAAFAGAEPRFSFAGSDELAAQIRRGVRPDVYAAADDVLPRRLFSEGLVERPVVFAGNRLVVAVPAGSEVDEVEDLAGPGMRVVIGTEDVPVGSYAREVLARLPAETRAAILANVRSNEPDVGGMVGKLTQGAADAGFLYATDLRPLEGRLEAVELAPGLRPRVRYAAAVVKGAAEPAAARRFLAGLVHGAGRRALARAGFEAPR